MRRSVTFHLGLYRRRFLVTVQTNTVLSLVQKITDSRFDVKKFQNNVSTSKPKRHCYIKILEIEREYHSFGKNLHHWF